MRIIPLILIIGLLVGIIIYYEKTRCIDDGSMNCNVNAWEFEKIQTGQTVSEVWEILGNKNVVSMDDVICVPDDYRKVHCREADSVLLWKSHRYPRDEISGIQVGFKNERVVCKTYAKALQVKNKK